MTGVRCNSLLLLYLFRGHILATLSAVWRVQPDVGQGGGVVQQRRHQVCPSQRRVRQHQLSAGWIETNSLHRQGMLLLFNPLFTHDALGQHKFDPIHLST